MFLCHICCRKRGQLKHIIRRRPSHSEMKQGVPEWFNVEEGHNDTLYISPEGARFASINDLKQWRESYVCMDERPYF